MPVHTYVYGSICSGDLKVPYTEVINGICNLNNRKGSSNVLASNSLTISTEQV